MKPSRLLFPLLGLSLLAPAGAGLAPRAWAQPQAPAEIAEVQGEWDKLRAATAELEATDAVAAIERYQKFYESRGRFDMRVSIQLSSLIAQLYWRELGNRDKAIEIYDWAIPLFGGHYDSPRLTRERALLVEGTTPLAAPVVIAPVSKTSVAQAKAAEPIRLGMGGKGVVAPGVAAVGVAEKTTGPAAVASIVAPGATTPGTALPDTITIASPLASIPKSNALAAVVLPSFLSVAPRTIAPQSVVVTPLASAATSPASVVSPAMVAAPAMAVTPATVAAPKAIAAASTAFTEVNVRSGVVAVLLAQMRSGALAPEEAWQNGDLKAEDVLYALQTPDVTDAKAKSDAPLRIALAGVLVRHAPQQLAPLTASAPLTLVLADYYDSVRDAKAVPLYEQLLAQVKAPVSTAPSPALKQLAAFYQSVGDYSQAADTLLRMENFTTMGAFKGNAGVEAARLYRQAGDEAKAAASYARVAQEGYGWATGLALYDQGSFLINQGQHEEARKILLQPVEGQYAEQIKVAMLALLGDSYFRTGEMEAARKYNEESIQQYEALKTPLQGENLEYVIEAARRRLHTIKGGGVYQSSLALKQREDRLEGWKKQPIQTDTKEIVFQANPSQPNRPLYARFRIKTYGDTTVTASVNNPDIQARVLPVKNWGREGLNAQEEEMEVIVQSNSLNPFKDVPLVLSSATRGETTTVQISLVEKLGRP